MGGAFEGTRSLHIRAPGRGDTGMNRIRTAFESWVGERRYSDDSRASEMVEGLAGSIAADARCMAGVRGSDEHSAEFGNAGSSEQPVCGEHTTGNFRRETFAGVACGEVRP